jgi:hypothetical protein
VKTWIKPLLIKLFIIDAVLLLLAVLSVYLWLDVSHLAGMIIAIIITTINAVAAVYLAVKGMKGTMNDFMLSAMGGMMLRLVILLATVFLILAFTNIPDFSFIIGLFISYICKSVVEIIFIQKIRNQSQLFTK